MSPFVFMTDHQKERVRLRLAEIFAAEDQARIYVDKVKSLKAALLKEAPLGDYGSGIIYEVKKKKILVHEHTRNGYTNIYRRRNR